MRVKSFKLATLAMFGFVCVGVCGCASQNPCGPYQGYPAYPQYPYNPYAAGQQPVMPVAPGAMPATGVPPGYNLAMGAPAYGAPVGAYPANSQPLLGR